MQTWRPTNTIYIISDGFSDLIINEQENEVENQAIDKSDQKDKEWQEWEEEEEVVVEEEEDDAVKSEDQKEEHDEHKMDTIVKTVEEMAKAEVNKQTRARGGDEGR